MSLMGDLGVEKVAEIERLALHAWPALAVEEAGGWLIRYASGITRRANSVWPNEVQSAEELEARLAHVESFYHERNLPARFQICPVAKPPYLDEFLGQRGYRAVARSAVQTAPLKVVRGLVSGNQELSVEVVEKPSAKWWECYGIAEDVGKDSVAGRMKICEAINVESAYALVMLDGEAIAVGSAAYEDGWIGFFNVATLRERRRIGAARTLMAALVDWGEQQGAHMAYLQVMADNVAALQLYGQLGFKTGYYYHYREEVLPAAKD